MASLVAENSVSSEQIRLRPRNQTNTSPDLNPQIPSTPQSRRCKSTISSLFLSFTNNANNDTKKGFNVSSALKNKKKTFASATFRGLGCTASSEVSAPAVIRTSADWQGKKMRKKKQRNPNKKKNQQIITGANNPNLVVVNPDVWCAPGIVFSADAASVDCVVSRRPIAGRRVDGERMSHRERSCSGRRTTNFEHISILDSPSSFETSRFGSDIYGPRHRNFRHCSPGGLTEMMMFQNSLLFGGRSDGYDQYRDWRLNVDDMSYEELLELGDTIGYVSTGLREDEVFRCLRKTKPSILDPSPLHFPSERDWNCSICQEEYKEDEEVGKLDCGHSYHVCCIKQWLLQKNSCPVCKVPVMARY